MGLDFASFVGLDLEQVDSASSVELEVDFASFVEVDFANSVELEQVDSGVAEAEVDFDTVEVDSVCFEGFVQ